jgi:hypothetical protein
VAVVVLIVVVDSVSVVVSGDGAVAGEEVVVVLLVLELLVDVEPPAGEGFTIVVLVSFLSPPAGVVTSVRCSQPASSAAPAKMQMDFFIMDWNA